MALLGQGNFSIRKEVQGVKKIYTRSQLQPITPVGDSPIGWSAVPSSFDNPPNYGNLWSSSATIDPNGVVQGTWSSPTLEEPYTSNPLDRFPFVVGIGDQNPYTRYGTDNIREIGLNPFGVSDIIWRGKSNISTGFCGGIDTSATYYYNLDNSKKYRVSFWFKRNTWSEGSFYFGLRGTVQQSSDWTDTSNYYYASAISAFPTATTDKWYFIVGYIYPSNQIEAIVEPKSGIYDPANGNMLRAMTGTPRQKEGVYKVGIRLSQYNCPTTDPEFRLWQPRIDLCDGREPSIEELLKGGYKTPTISISGETVFKFSSGQTAPENTSVVLTAEVLNGQQTYQWQWYQVSTSSWVNLLNGTSQTYSLAYNSGAFNSTNIAKIRCFTTLTSNTYISNVLTITKVYDGIAGSNQAPLFLYQRSATSPAKPTNTAVWTFATASYSTAPNNGWETAIQASNGTPCWVIQAVASGNGATDTIAPTDWSTPRVLVQDGITATLLDLTNETTVVSVDYNGNPIGSIEVTQANVYEGNVLASGWTFTNVDSGCTSSIAGGVVTVSAMPSDKATVTIKANKTGYSELTAVYSLTKLYPAKDGLPTPVYSLLPEHSSISKSKTGILTPSTTSCRVKLSVNGQTEIVGDPKIMYEGRNLMNQPLSATGYSGATASFDLADISLVPTEWNAIGARRLITSGGDGILKLYFGTPTVALGIIRSSSVYVKNMGSTDITVHSNLGGIGVNVSAGESKRVLMPNIVGNGSGGLQFQFITLLASDNIDCIVYGFQTEENSYCTPFTFSPENHKILRDGNAYTIGASRTIGSTATEVVWALIDPKGTTIDTERIPIVVDGTDGANGNDGLNNTIVTLYKRSLASSPEVPPSKPSSGTIVYNFSNLTVSGDLAGWQIDAPTFVAGTKLFKIAASVASYTTTTSIIPLAWVGPVKTEDTEAADLLRGDFRADIERLDDRIGLEVEGVYSNGLGKVVQTNTSNISLVPGKISLAVKEVQVGSLNFVKNSRCNSITNWDPMGQFTKSVVNDAKYGSVVELERTSGSGEFQKTFTVDKIKTANTTLIYYVIAKRISTTGDFQYGGWSETWTRLKGSTANKIDYGDGWYMYWTSFTSGASIATNQFGLNTITGKWRFYAVGVCVGTNPPSTWSEFPEDIGSELFSTGIDITAKLITLNGDTKIIDSLGTPVALFTDGKIKGSFIEAATIKAEDIDASKIKAEDIDASKIKTQNLITTNLNVTSGAKVGGFKVDGSRIINDQTDSNGAIYLTKSSENKVIALDVQGGLPASSGVYPLLYIKNHDIGLPNYGLIIDVANGVNYSENHAIAIRSGFISGFARKPIVITSGYNASVLDGTIICNNTSNINITLPSTTAWDGREIIVVRASTGGVTITDVTGLSKIWDAGSQVASISLGGYACGMFFFVNGIWHYRAFYR